MTNIESAAMLKRELDALRPISGEQEARIWQKFRFDWNYHSNNIEGNSLTFGETKSLLLHNITAQGKPLKDHIEITGHNQAIDELIEISQGSRSVTEAFIRNLHTLILRERYLSQAETAEGVKTTKWIEVGQYKTASNHVKTATGEIFRFAEPMDVPEKMRELCQKINDSPLTSDTSALIQAAKLHYDFVLIHPFDDGNGRMARLMMNLMLIRYGFPPAIVKTEDKSNYFSALRQADGGQIEVFVEYIAGCVCTSLKTMLAGARGESIDEPDEQDRQIKMLERLLDQKVGKVSKMRDAESVAEVFHRFFSPCAKRLDLAARRFESMYLKLETSAAHMGGYTRSKDAESFERPLNTDLQYIESCLADVTSTLMFFASFSNLKFSGFDKLTYRAELIINLHPGHYEVTNTFGAQTIKRSYGQEITEEELSGLEAQMKRHHIKYIEDVTGTSVNSL
jgi:Fic family protein